MKNIERNKFYMYLLLSQSEYYFNLLYKQDDTSEWKKSTILNIIN